jgi:hypothetical protein
VHCYLPITDTDFSAYARLLQSKWRVKKHLPFVSYGNFLPADIAKRDKSNFLTDKIKTLVQYELYRKGIFGKLIKEDRLLENILSSQPLCFNLFGELHFDLKLATKYFKKLFPDKIEFVTEVLFEHSPGRGDNKFTGDHSAFDVFIEYNRGKTIGFIGIEVKYAESLKEETQKTATATFKKHEPEYKRLTNPDIFKPDAIEILKQVPLSQIWRDHLLSIATRTIYDEGFFVFLFPSKNEQCQNGVDDYKKYLSSTDEEKTGFYPRHLEDFVNALTEILPADWTKELKERYIGTGK